MKIFIEDFPAKTAEPEKPKESAHIIQIRREFAFNKRLTCYLFVYSIASIVAISYWLALKIKQGDLWQSGNSCGRSLLANAALFIVIQELFSIAYVLNLNHQMSHRRFFRTLYGNNKFILGYHFTQLVLLMGSIVNVNSQCSENSFSSFFLILVFQTILILVNLAFAMYYSLRVYRRIHDLVNKKGDKAIQEIFLDIPAIISTECMRESHPDYIRNLIAIGNEAYTDGRFVDVQEIASQLYTESNEPQLPKKVDESSILDISDFNASF